MALAVRWFPQSWVQLRTDDRLIYIDPSSVNTPLDLLAAKLPRSTSRTRLPSGMDQGDLILVTHAHLDHVDRGLVGRLSKEGTVVLAPPKCRRKLGDLMTLVRPGEDIVVSGLTVRAVNAYNPEGSRKVIYHRKGDCVGYVIEADGRRIYHAGDTGLIDEMSDLGSIDLAFLPIGGKFTMDVDEAVEAVKRMRPGLVVPMHMMRASPEEFKAKVEEGSASKVRVLAPGEELRLQ